MTNEQWYKKFDDHLMKDASPSNYFNNLIKEQRFPGQYPFSMLGDLVHLEQSAVYHPEGDAFVHTMLVVDNAAQRRHLSKEPRVFMWAALLHDLGKKLTTKRRKGKITAYDHDKAGRQLALRFLTECGQDESFVKRVAALVRWHMQALFVIRNLPFSNLDRMTAEVDIDEVALLALCDRLGRGNTSSQQILTEQKNIVYFIQKCREYLEKKGRLPTV